MHYILISILSISIFFTSCTNAQVASDPIPKHESHKIQSAAVNEERVINVWIPDSYIHSADSLPVIYMADGGINEDFPHIANTISQLISENKIPPYILVGIENTVRRRDLIGPTKVKSDLKLLPQAGGADNFRKFIKEELFPYINAHYRTTNTRAIIGESAAGLFIVETFLLDNDLFDYYIAIDPSLWFNNQYLVKQYEILSKPDYNFQKKLFLASSNTKDIAPHTKQLVEKIQNGNQNLIWHFADKPNEKHNTIFRATKENALIWTLNESNND